MLGRDQQLVDESPDEHGQQEVLLLLEVVGLDLLQNELPHVLHRVEGGVGALVDVEPRRELLLTVLFDSLDQVVLERLSAFFDFDGAAVEHPSVEPEGLLDTVPIGELLNVEIHTIVTYLDTSSFSTRATGPTLPKNLLR